jgi:hypothetical protein
MSNFLDLEHCLEQLKNKSKNVGSIEASESNFRYFSTLSFPIQWEPGQHTQEKTILLTYIALNFSPASVDPELILSQQRYNLMKLHHTHVYTSKITISNKSNQIKSNNFIYPPALVYNCIPVYEEISYNASC